MRTTLDGSLSFGLLYLFNYNMWRATFLFVVSVTESLVTNVIGYRLVLYV